MDLKIVCGIMAGIAIALAVVVAVLKWRAGRAARKGRRGERAVAKELRRLKRKDTVVLNDLLLPTQTDRTSQIDHVVVSVRGIFVVETKSIAGRITGSEHAQYWTQHLSSQSRQIYNPILQNRAHLRALRRVLPRLDESLFTSVVVFTEAWRLDIKADDIVEPRRFLSDRIVRRTFLPSGRRKRHWWRPGREVRLDEANIVTPLDDLVGEIARRPKVIPRENLQEIARAVENAAVQDPGVMKAHTAYAKETSRNVSREIRQGNCPRCGGRLLLKKSERGEFVGCENYPSCRFTCSIDHLH